MQASPRWRIIFMGTPVFAVPSLEALLTSTGDGEVVAVVSQPDRAAGRGRRLTAPPVARVAREHGVPVHQPATLRDPHVHTELERLTPDLIVVAAYGKLLPRPILDLPAHGCINVHASLLPRHRGAAPIQSALLAGDRSTGVTIMQMNEGMDEGDILLQRPVPIEAIDTSESLGERLARVGAAALLEAIAGIKGGTLTPQRQDSAAATYAPRITKEMGRVDWTKPSVLLEREVRAFQPWPAAHTSLWGKQLKLLGARVGGESISAAPGTVVTSDPSGITVGTGDGTLVLTTMQLEGQRPLSVADFIRGRPVPPGTVFGS